MRYTREQFESMSDEDLTKIANGEAVDVGSYAEADAGGGRTEVGGTRRYTREELEKMSDDDLRLIASGKPPRQKGHDDWMPKPHIVTDEESAANGEMGISDTAANMVEQTGQTASDSTAVNFLTNAGNAISGNLVPNLRKKALQTLAKGWYEKDGRRQYLDWEPEEQDRLLDQALVGGWSGVARAAGSAVKGMFGGKAIGGNELMKEWEDTDGRKYEYGSLDWKGARAKHASEIAKIMLGMDTATEQNAQTDARNRESTHAANIIAKGAPNLAYTAAFVGGPWGIALQTALNAAGKAEGLQTDAMAYDEDGNLVTTAKGDTSGRAWLKGSASALAETGSEIFGGKIGGAIAKRAMRPVAGAASRVIGSTKAGQSVLRFGERIGNLFERTSRKAHLENPFEENLEEIQTAQFDALFGTNRRDSELKGTNAAGRLFDATKDFFTPKNFLEMNEAMLLTMGAGAFVAAATDSGKYRAGRGTLATGRDEVERQMAGRRVDDIIRAHGLLSDEKLKNATTEEKTAALNAWIQGLSEDEIRQKIDKATGLVDRLANRIEGQNKFADNVNALAGEMEKAQGKNRFSDLTTSSPEAGSFDFTKVVGVRAKNSRGEDVTEYRDDQSGVTVEESTDADGNARFQVRRANGGYALSTEGGAYMASADEAAAVADKEAREQNIKTLERGDKDKFLRSEIGRIGIPGDYEIVGSIGELSDIVPDVVNNAKFNPDNPSVLIPEGAQLSDGTRLQKPFTAYVLDNIGTRDEATRKVLHEAGVHLMLDQAFADADDRAKFLNSIDKRAVKYGVDFVARSYGKTADEVMDDPKLREEALAHTVEAATGTPTMLGKFTGVFRTWARKMGADIPLNDAELGTALMEMRGKMFGPTAINTEQEGLAEREETARETMRKLYEQGENEKEIAAGFAENQDEGIAGDEQPATAGYDTEAFLREHNQEVKAEERAEQEKKRAEKQSNREKRSAEVIDAEARPNVPNENQNEFDYRAKITVSDAPKGETKKMPIYTEMDYNGNKVKVGLVMRGGKEWGRLIELPDGNVIFAQGATSNKAALEQMRKTLDARLPKTEEESNGDKSENGGKSGTSVNWGTPDFVDWVRKNKKRNPRYEDLEEYEAYKAAEAKKAEDAKAAERKEKEHAKRQADIEYAFRDRKSPNASAMINESKRTGIKRFCAEHAGRYPALEYRSEHGNRIVNGSDPNIKAYLERLSNKDRLFLTGIGKGGEDADRLPGVFEGDIKPEEYLDKALSEYHDYLEWKDKGALSEDEQSQRDDQERQEAEDAEIKWRQEAERAEYAEYALDALAAKDDADEEYAKAIGFIENEYDAAEEAKLSPENLAKAEPGVDVIRVDHHDKTFVFADWNAEDGILTVFDMDREADDGGTIYYRVTQDGIQEAKGYGQGNENGTSDTRTDAKKATGKAGGGKETAGNVGAGAGEETADAEITSLKERVGKPENADFAAALEGATSLNALSDIVEEKAKEYERDADDWAKREYKPTDRTVEVDGETRRVDEINEGRRKQKIAELRGKADALRKAYADAIGGTAQKSTNEDDAAYQAWLEKYNLKDTAARRKEFAKKQVKPPTKDGEKASAGAEAAKPVSGTTGGELTEAERAWLGKTEIGKAIVSNYDNNVGDDKEFAIKQLRKSIENNRDALGTPSNAQGAAKVSEDGQKGTSGKAEAEKAPMADSAPSVEEAKAASKVLGMDTALPDGQLRFKMNAWLKHVGENEKFAEKAEAAKVLLADRAAKGKADAHATEVEIMPKPKAEKADNGKGNRSYPKSGKVAEEVYRVLSAIDSAKTVQELNAALAGFKYKDVDMVDGEFVDHDAVNNAMVKRADEIVENTEPTGALPKADENRTEANGNVPTDEGFEAWATGRDGTPMEFANEEERAKARATFDNLVKRGRVDGKTGESITRWSKVVTPEEDAAYAEAVARGDRKTALRMMLDAAAKVMEMPVVVYKNTRGEFFIRRDKNRSALFFSDNFDQADSYFSRERKLVSTSVDWSAIESEEQLIKAFKNIGRENELGESDAVRIDNDQYWLPPYIAEEIRQGKWGADKDGRQQLVHDKTEKVLSWGYILGWQNIKRNAIRLAADDTGKYIIDTKDFVKIDARGKSWDDLLKVTNGRWKTTDDIADYSTKNGIGFIITNVKDTLVRPGEKSFAATDYIVPQNISIKSADPVTYDDAGNVIPLSERFNPKKDDIRWSMAVANGGIGDIEAFDKKNPSMFGAKRIWLSAQDFARIQHQKPSYLVGKNRYYDDRDLFPGYVHHLNPDTGDVTTDVYACEYQGDEMFMPYNMTTIAGDNDNDIMSAYEKIRDMPAESLRGKERSAENSSGDMGIPAGQRRETAGNGGLSAREGVGKGRASNGEDDGAFDGASGAGELDVKPRWSKAAEEAIPKDVRDELSGISQDRINHYRAKVGLPPLESKRRTLDEMEREGQGLFANRDLVNTVVDAVNKKPRSLSEAETIAIGLAHTEAQQQYDVKMAEVDEAMLRNNKADAARLRIEADAIKDRVEAYGRALYDTRSVTARVLALGRVMINRDLTLAGITVECEALKGKPLTEDEKRDIAEAYRAVRDAIAGKDGEVLRELTKRIRAAATSDISAIAAEAKRRGRSGVPTDVDGKFQDALKQLDAWNNVSGGILTGMQGAKNTLDDIIRYHIANGVGDGKDGKAKYDAVMGATLATVRQHLGGATMEEIEQGVSGYGISRPLSLDETELAVRDMNLQAKRYRALEDLLNKKLPKTTGDKRAPTSEEVKRLDSEIREKANELKMQNGLSPEEMQKLVAKRLEQLDKRLSHYRAMLMTENFKPKEQRAPRIMTPEILAKEKEVAAAMKKIEERKRHYRSINTPGNFRIGKNYAFDYLKMALAAPRVLRTMLDLSATGAQGAALFVSHPIEGAKALGKSIAAFYSSKKADELQLAMDADPDWQEFQKFGGHAYSVSDIALDAVPEEFRAADTSIKVFGKDFSLDRIPGVKASERSFGAFLNVMNLAMYKAMKNGGGWSDPAGPTDTQKRDLAEALNVASGYGYGREGKGWWDKVMSAAFWAPRYTIAGVKQAVGYEVWSPLFRGGKDERTAKDRLVASKQLAKEEARRLTAMAAWTLLATLLFGKKDPEWIEEVLDPRSGHFGNVRIGNREISFLGPMKQWLTFMARFINGNTVKNGVERESNRMESIGRLARGKMSPLFGLGWDLLSREDYVGDKIEWGRWRSGVNAEGDKAIGAVPHMLESFGYPLSMADVTEALKEDGVAGAMMMTPFALTGFAKNSAPVNDYNLVTDSYKDLSREYRRVKGEDPRAARKMLEDNPELKDARRVDDLMKYVRAFEKKAREYEDAGKPVPEYLTRRIEDYKRRAVEAVRKARQ